MSMNERSPHPPDRIRLPLQWRKFFEEDGVLPAIPNDRRRFARRRLRVKSVLEIERTIVPEAPDSPSCAYVRDVSRSGVSFVLADQLFPGDEVTLQVGGRSLRAVVVRCLRYNDQCYVIGASFTRPA